MRALRKLNEEVWGNLTDIGMLERLRQYIQASSALSFAAHGQVYTDSDLRQVHIRAQDYVSMNLRRYLYSTVGVFDADNRNAGEW